MSHTRFFKKPSLSIDKADHTLQNVFSSRQMLPNTVPLSRIVRQQKTDFIYFKYTISVSFFVLLLTLLMPFFVLFYQTKTPSAYHRWSFLIFYSSIFAVSSVSSASAVSSVVSSAVSSMLISSSGSMSSPKSIRSSPPMVPSSLSSVLSLMLR